MVNTQTLLIVLMFFVIVVLVAVVIAIYCKHIDYEPFEPIGGSKDYNDGVFIPKIETKEIDNLFDLIYPLNSIYITTNKDFNPNTMGKDTWVKASGFVIPGGLIDITEMDAMDNVGNSGLIMIVINDYDETILNSNPTEKQTSLKTMIDNLKNNKYRLYKLYVWKKTNKVSLVETTTKTNNNESFTFANNTLNTNKMNINKITNPYLLYPVGSFYYTADESFDPNQQFGGKWELYNKNIIPGGILFPLIPLTTNFDNDGEQQYGNITYSTEYGKAYIRRWKKDLQLSEDFVVNNYVIRVWQRVE